MAPTITLPIRRAAVFRVIAPLTKLSLSFRRYTLPENHFRAPTFAIGRPRAAAPHRSGSMPRYFQLTRKHSYALLFALPLLVLYEAGAAMVSGDTGLRNGADVMLRTLLAAGGIHSTLVFTGILLIGGILLVARERRREKVPLRAPVFAGMAAESVIYALVFGTIVGAMTSWVLTGVRLAADPGGSLDKLPLGETVVLSLGAGFYEELLFRVLLVGGLLAVFKSAGIGKTARSIWAALLAAFLFSGFHYVGPYAYPLELGSCTFRVLSGLALNARVITRGFGITAWTHALYDIYVMALR